MVYEVEPGMIIGKWTIIEAAPKRKRERYWLCRCQCGVQREVGMSALRIGRSLSCQACSMKIRSMRVRATPGPKPKEISTYTPSALDKLLNKHLKS